MMFDGALTNTDIPQSRRRVLHKADIQGVVTTAGFLRNTDFISVLRINWDKILPVASKCLNRPGTEGTVFFGAKLPGFFWSSD